MMRRSAVLVGLVVLALARGCERGEPLDEPKVYDPAVDAPPSTIMVRPNPLLLANQVEIAKRSPKVTPAPAPAAPARAGGASIDSVKATLLQLLDVVEADLIDAVPDFFVPEDSAMVRSVVADLPAIQEKLATVGRLVRERFGVDLPAEQIQMATGKRGMALATWMDRAILMAEPSPLQFLPQGDKIVVSRDGQEPITLVNLDGTWKIQLSPEERVMVGMAGEVVKATAAMADALIAGINDGTITRDNLQAQMQALQQRHLGPIMAKLAETTSGATAEAAGAGPGARVEEGVAPPEPERPAEVELPQYEGQPDDPTRLELVITLWLANSSAEALGQFVRIDWDKPAGFRGTSPFAISQMRFAAMPGAEREAMTEHVTVQIKAVKELTTRLSEMAAQAAAAGDEAKAQTYVQAIRGCAEFLQQTKRLTVLREAGRAIAEMPNPLAGGTAIAATVKLTRPGEGPADPGYLETIGTIWASKDKEGALKEFLRIDWGKPAILAPDSIFLMTSEKMLAMDSSQRDLTAGQASAFDKALREFSQYVLDQVRSSPQPRGPAAAGKRYTDALANLSSFLQQPQQLLVLQVRGENIARMTNPTTGAPIGTGVNPPPSVVAPTIPAAAPPAPAATEEDINAGRGPEAAEELRNRLLAPARRVYGGEE